MTRVLVTDASSRPGRALVDALLADPTVELVVAVHAAPPDRPDGPRLRHLAVDLAHPRQVRTLLFGPTRALAVDTIVHAGVKGTRELLRLGDKHPTLRRFIYRSSATVYHVGADAVDIIDEEHPVELAPRVPQWVRDSVAADLAVLAHAGLSSMRILVLRCAEIFAEGCGSQLYDYLASKVCFRALGYDPMVELLSLEDATRALRLAVPAEAQGVLNIPGADVLPLSRLIAKHGRHEIAVPGPLLAPLYALRTLVLHSAFRYDANAGRFHFGNVLDGRRARAALGYEPRVSVSFSPPRSFPLFASRTNAQP